MVVARIVQCTIRTHEVLKHRLCQFLGRDEPARLKGGLVQLQKAIDRYGTPYEKMARAEFPVPTKRCPLVLYIGCVGMTTESETTQSAIQLLNRLGVDFTLIDEVCCSGVLEDVGYEINEDLARINMDLILATAAKMVITGCPYCFRTFNNKPQYAELREKGIKVVHITQFLKDFELSVKTDKRVTYHDPCDLGRHSGIYEEPRETIRKLAPNFIEMYHHHADALCCGAGGGVRGAYAKNSIAMARRRLEEAEEIGAEVVLTECNSCVHNLSNAKLRKQKFRIYNTTQFINELMEEAQ